ncbi:MAG TPA: crosslink repair DNA glycosylase YcaQ family protein [Gemmatimonadaceae bacterium]|nr:crosslink repair DNA glycosylase YcaQ family protein [Gemmatimonadaceae bacterium]
MPRLPDVTLADLRRFAIARTLFAPTTLARALTKLGFVQADPIRAPARAQDLTLRHRVTDYRAGDLEQRYARLAIEEDFFVNYGFVTRQIHRLMHPRGERRAWTRTQRTRAVAVLEFVRERGAVHPRDVDAHFAHGKVTNWFGGTSNASTQLLDGMHYRGLLRIARREGGIRVYAAREQHEPAADPIAAMDALVNVIVGLYAPLPERSLGELVSRLAFGAPQWSADRRTAFKRALERLPCTTIDAVRWRWPEGENPRLARHAVADEVRLLAPFDPVVWDRRRFELFWGWAYRFEAYTPAAKRVRGYYALPMLWRDQVIGWANLSMRDGALAFAPGYVSGAAPPDGEFRRALDAELSRFAAFIGAQPRS